MKDNWVKGLYEAKTKIVTSSIKLYLIVQDFIVEAIKVVCTSVLFLLFGIVISFVLVILWISKLVKREKR